jgi:hypothetical protein
MDTAAIETAASETAATAVTPAMVVKRVFMTVLLE